MKPIEAQVKRSYYVRVALIGILSVGLGALLMWLEYRRWVRVLDGTGATRRDGKQFLWANLREVKVVRMRLRSGQLGGLNHVELVFSDGKALVFPLMLENRREVMAFIGGLPGGEEVARYG
jgi:hypothetical protein